MLLPFRRFLTLNFFLPIMSAIILGFIRRFVRVAPFDRFAQFLEFIRCVLDVSSSRNEEFTPSLACDCESSNAWLVNENFRWQHDLCFEFSQEHVDK